MIGRTISHYRVFERLGGGGMGLVYRARDTRLDRDVALKFLPPEWSHEALLRERFSREARAASALDHPHICTVYDIGETDEGQLFIAMAYCPGRTLKQSIHEGPMPIGQAVDYAIQIAEALESAHEAGIVHRDIKPANILISDRDQLKVVDFGLAKLAGEAAVTREGTVIGTPAYMSPEQVNGEEVDGRSDIWALGAVIYEMLTGRRAFAAEHERAVLLSILSHDPTPPENVRPDLPAELARIIRRCLKRDAGKRYQSAAELLADLRRFRGEISPAEIITQSLPSAPRVRRRWLLKHRVLPAAAAVLVVLALGALVLPTLDRGRARHLLVLPFDCHSDDAETASLCEGLLDTVTNRLTAIRRYRSSLSVVPLSEVRRQRVASADEAHRIFGVDLVLSGGVQRVGENLRVSLQLVDATQLRQLVARLVTTGDEPGFAVQDQVVAVAEEMLELELTPQERRAIAAGGTEIPEAAQRLLEARGVVGPNPTPSDLGRAAELFRSALELDPAYADAMVGLAEVCERRFEFGEDPIWLEHGLSYAERALDIDPTLPGAHLAAGRCELARHAYAEAVKRFERTLELDPLNLPAYLALAAALEDGGEPERAGAVIDRALRTGPDDWQTHHQVGRFFYERFQLERAMEHFERVIELLPSSSIGYAARGGCRIYLGDRSGARDDLERAIALGPSYWALHNLATLEYYEGNYAAAAERYRQSLAIDDTDYRVWSALAESQRHAEAGPGEIQNAYLRAAELAERRLQGDPDDVAALVNLASFRIHLGEPPAARELLGRAVRIGTDDPELMYWVAESAERLGDRELALQWIARALGAGYPLQVIEDYPDLADLRADPRYKELAGAAGGKLENSEPAKPGDGGRSALEQPAARRGGQGGAP